MMLIDLISREGGSTVRESGSAEVCNDKYSSVSGRNAARNYLAFFQPIRILAAMIQFMRNYLSALLMPCLYRNMKKNRFMLLAQR